MTLSLPVLGQDTKVTDPVLRRAHQSVSAAPRVLALYYGWYGTPQVSKRWLHYEKVDPAARKIGSQPHYPALGPYDSTDAAVLERHLKQAKDAGIDTLVCSWWGKDDQTDRSFRAMLPLAAQHGLTLCPLYEQVARPVGPASLSEDWRYLLQEYGGSPAFLKVDGKPVVFVYARARSQLTLEQWAEALVALEREAAPGVLALADGTDLAETLVFDGLFRFDPGPLALEGVRMPVAVLFQANHRPLLERARRFRRVPVLTLTPEREEGKVQPDRAAPAVRTGMPAERRQGGALYRAQWEAALREKGTWVLINSFNQWHTGTEIEPSLEYKEQYLKLTAEYAARYRQATAPASPQK